MTTGNEMFLLVCEEMSFSAAARRAFVTQQCLSDHIRRLEEAHQVKLFTRRPRLALTPAGQAMLATLRQIQALEQGLDLQLGQYSQGTRGEVRFGINSGRAGVLLPRVFPQYHALFPYVKLFAVDRETREMEQLLAKGGLDVFLGIDTQLNDALTARPLGREKLYLTLPLSLLRQRFGAGCDARLGALAREGADLRDFADVPFVERGSPSTTTRLIHQHCLRQGVDIQNMLNINDFSNQMELCALFPAAAITPAMILPKVEEYNRHCPPERRLLVFPILHLEDTLRVDLVRRAGAPRPPYLAAFEDLVAKETLALEEQVAAAPAGPR